MKKEVNLLDDCFRCEGEVTASTVDVPDEGAEIEVVGSGEVQIERKIDLEEELRSLLEG